MKENDQLWGQRFHVMALSDKIDYKLQQKLIYPLVFA